MESSDLFSHPYKPEAVPNTEASPEEVQVPAFSDSPHAIRLRHPNETRGRRRARDRDHGADDLGVPDRGRAASPHRGLRIVVLIVDGKPLQPLEISGVHGNRIHKLDVPAGNVRVDYAATIIGRTDPAPVTEYDLSMYLRPSRYAEADKFYGFAATEFGNYADSTTLLEKVSSWVGHRLNYVPGSSDPIDGAVDTLLAGAGCVPRLRASGGGDAAGGVRTGPGGVGVRAGPVSDGLPCRG